MTGGVRSHPGLELVQDPPCSRCRVGSMAARSGSRSCGCQRSRFSILVRSATRSSRWPTSNLISRPAHPGEPGAASVPAAPPGPRPGVDRIRLARDPASLPRLGHQAGRHHHDLLYSGQQIGQQPTGHVPAVLDPLRPALAGPADQLLVVAGPGAPAGGLGQLPADRVGGHHRVAGLVGVHAQRSDYSALSEPRI
jgi:hypothetical protein